MQKKKIFKQKVFKLLAKATVIDDFSGPEFEVKLKECIARGNKYVCICSVHGRWFVPIPLDLWPRIVRAGNSVKKSVPVSV